MTPLFCLCLRLFSVLGLFVLGPSFFRTFGRSLRLRPLWRLLGRLGAPLALCLRRLGLLGLLGLFGLLGLLGLFGLGLGLRCATSGEDGSM